MSGSSVLLNLASEEYFRAVQQARLGVSVVSVVFEDLKAGRYKVISFNAKRARGTMARFMIRHRIDEPRALRTFTEGGYRFAPDVSRDDRLVFRRDGG